MQPYRNLSGESGVVAYELGPEHIRIRFDNGNVYTYDYRRPGRRHVEQMKRLATAGRGLCSYISRRSARTSPTRPERRMRPIGHSLALPRDPA